MTVTSQGKTPGASKLVVRDEVGPLPFVGEMVADLSWSFDEAHARGHQRWTDITLYRVMQRSEYKYLIQVVGRSVVYHDPTGSCHRGVNVTVGALARDDDRYQALDPCRECRPQDLGEIKDDAFVVAVEENLYTLHRCKTADAVVDVLYRRGNHLSLKLLQTASAFDDGILKAMAKMRKL